MIRQPSANNQARDRKKANLVRHLAVVESERLLVEVSEQVKRLNRNIRALDAALQETPEILKSIRMNVAFDILNRVVNHLVNVLIHSYVGTKRIGYQLRALRNVLSDRLVNDMLLAAFNYLEAYFATLAFKQTHHRYLADKSSLAADLLSSLILVHESSSAADECLVGFNPRARAAQLLKGSRLHRQSDSVHQEPRGLLSDAKAAMDFIRANPVLRSTDHPDSRKPLIKADRGIFHQGSKLDREHFLAGFTLPRPARRNERVFVRLATRAGNDAIRPAQRDHKGQRVVWISKVNDCLLKRFREGVLLFLRHSEAILAF